MSDFRNSSSGGEDDYFIQNDFGKLPGESIVIDIERDTAAALAASSASREAALAAVSAMTAAIPDFKNVPGGDGLDPGFTSASPFTSSEGFAAPFTGASVSSAPASSAPASLFSSNDSQTIAHLRAEIQQLMRQLWSDSQKHQQEIFTYQEKNILLEQQLLSAENRQRELIVENQWLRSQVSALEQQMRVHPSPLEHPVSNSMPASQPPLFVSGAAPGGASAAAASRGVPVTLGHPLIQERDEEIDQLRMELENAQALLDRERIARRRETGAETYGKVPGGVMPQQPIDVMRTYEHVEKLATERAMLQLKYENMKKKAIKKTKELQLENERLQRLKQQQQ